METTAARVEYVPLSEIREASRNPKDHDVGALARSISRFGFVAPLIVNEYTGRLVAGHGRLDALRWLQRQDAEMPARIRQGAQGWEVPVLRGVAFSDEKEAEAYLMADNRTTELGGWDWAAAFDVLTDHYEWGTLDYTGYDAQDLQRIGEDVGRIEGGWYGTVREETPASSQARPSDSFLTTVEIADLKPHPRNYRTHPSDQLEHLEASLLKNGFYRNIVCAKDLTILTGHGMVEAARRCGIKTAPARVLKLDPMDSRALAILTGDNELDHLAEVDDRALTEILKELNEVGPETLLGTGYDQMMLANLAFVTRPASEIRGHDEAAHWVGMPEYEPQDKPDSIVVNFEGEEERRAFYDRLGITEAQTWGGRSMWWPPKEREDPASLIFEG